MQRLSFPDPVNTHLDAPVDYAFRDQYTPSDDGQTPPWSDFPSPLQHMTENEFPANSSVTVENFDHLHIGEQDGFHPDQSRRRSPSPVSISQHEYFAPAMLCPSITAPDSSQSFDGLSVPDDNQSFLQVPETPPHGVEVPYRARRWSSVDDDAGGRCHTAITNSTRYYTSTSRSLEHDSRFPVQPPDPDPSQVYHSHVSTPSSPPVKWPGVFAIVPSYIPPSSRADMYGRRPSIPMGSPAGLHPHSSTATPTHIEGMSVSSPGYHNLEQLHHLQYGSMVKPSVTSRAVRNASNNRIRHPPKHLCPDCHERFTTTGNLRNHLNSHYGIRPYTCSAPGCGRTFVTKSDCKRHQGKLH